MVHGGVGDARTCFDLLHVRANGGEGGREVVEGHEEGSARMVDGEGDILHSSPIFLEGRDEGGLFDRLLRDLVVVTEVWV